MAGGRLIAVFGELSEILVLDAATCEQTHTLLSRQGNFESYFYF